MTSRIPSISRKSVAKSSGYCSFTHDEKHVIDRSQWLSTADDYTYIPKYLGLIQTLTDLLIFRSTYFDIFTPSVI